ncbi:MAG: hypothetical protein OJJ21_18685 [Ferrovibrio sp.]|uniref:hypothetical protein n=1 Tax=Ferrovibrio sp. TaxID=1917215 RepID=UPI0026094C21|nr:hypothetical protein [Ferrovibrio sp.]MCW0235635.1 hypothetical protein [Ferrovibrio sp.]
MSDLGPLVPAASVATGTPAAPATAPGQPSAAVPPSAGQTVPPAQTASPPPSPTTVLQSDATALAASASELAKGGQIAAQVVARDNLALLVRTAAGNTLALTNLAQAFEQANIAVLNAAIKLQLNPANPQQATVISANGTTLQPPLTALAQPPTAAQLALAVSPPQPAGNAAAPVLPQVGQTLTAVVVTPPAGNTGAPVLPPGSQLQVVVQSVTLPAAAPAASAVPGAAVPSPTPAAPVPATPPVPAAPVPATPVATLPLPATPAQPVTPQSPGAAPPALPSATAILAQAQAQQAPSVVPAPQIPAAPQAPVPPAILQAATGTASSAVPLSALPAGNLLAPGSAGQIVTGIVSGQGQAGQVLVSTPQGVLSLNLPQALPPGTQLALELAAITRPPTPTPTALGPAPLAGVLNRLQDGWPVLQQTLDAVRAADPALAQRLQAELLPQPNARLAATALQFMAAAAAGSAQAWLGSEAVRRLEQSGRGDLLRKLDDDFRELGRLNQRQGDNDWQALVMPMMVGGKVEAIQIFMRRRKDPKRQQKQTRFIIDFNLESTGPIQFDGFVGTKQLDLILRSETAFGPAFRLDVSAIFEEALAVTGMVGSLRFHDREKPLAWPSPELDSRGPSTEIKA